MRLKILGLVVALVAGGMLAFGSGIAASHQRTFASVIPNLNAGLLAPGDPVVFGRVLSGNPRCRANRLVRMFFRYDGGPLVGPIDQSTTSRLGYFGLGIGNAETEGLSRVIVRAPRKRIGPKTKQHRHICAPAFISLPAGG